MQQIGLSVTVINEDVVHVAEGEGPTDVRALHEGAVAGLLRPLVDPGFRLALAMLHDAQAAEDVVQEASFVAWQKVGTMRDPDRLRSWFLGIVANKCRNARRRKWVANVRLGVPDHLAVASAEDHVLRGADLRRAV